MKIMKTICAGLGAVLIAGAAYVGYAAYETRQDINVFEEAVISKASGTAANTVQAGDLDALPAPVHEYFAYVFPDEMSEMPRWVTFEQEGQFRRPLTEGFAHTTARQVLATSRPDLVFSANTPIFGPIWAIAYDSFIDGNMEMEARLLSAVSVMHEFSTPVLDQISLRRWLLESPSNPYALLPGGIVEWTAIDQTQALATARAHGYAASLIATFDDTGALISFHAEEDGDLTTPYHGSGEHVARGGYELNDGVRIPMTFVISRMADEQLYPFWSGRLTSFSFE